MPDSRAAQWRAAPSVLPAYYPSRVAQVGGVAILLDILNLDQLFEEDCCAALKILQTIAQVISTRILG